MNALCLLLSILLLIGCTPNGRQNSPPPQEPIEWDYMNYEDENAPCVEIDADLSGAPSGAGDCH